VMLHELCHNEIGPHNKLFFKLLDEITLECEALMVGADTRPLPLPLVP